MLLTNLWVLGLVSASCASRHDPTCSSAATIFVTHMSRQTATNVVWTKLGGGFGNQFNCLTHGFMYALVTGKKLLVVPQANTHGLFNSSDYFAHTPLWTYATHEQIQQLEADGNTSVTQFRGRNYDPFSPGMDDQLTFALWTNITHDVSMLWSCASRMLLQPGRLVAAAMTPHLAALDAAHESFGVHIRVGYAEMAQEDPVAMARFRTQWPASLHRRPQCNASAAIVDDTISHVDAIFHGMAASPRTVVVYVAGDSSSTIRNIREALAGRDQVRVISSEGKPQITSEVKTTFVPGSTSDPYLKAAVDFFMLSSIDRWYSNCDFLACFHNNSPARLAHDEPSRGIVQYADEERLGQVQKNTAAWVCGNTFANSIWIQRFAADARSPILWL